VLPAVVLLLLFGSMAAWVLARRSGPLIAILYSIGISGIVLPPAVITLVLLLRQLGIAGTTAGMESVGEPGGCRRSAVGDPDGDGVVLVGLFHRGSAVETVSLVVTGGDSSERQVGIADGQQRRGLPVVAMAIVAM
jgi:hypothetical protein